MPPLEKTPRERARALYAERGPELARRIAEAQKAAEQASLAAPTEPPLSPLSEEGAGEP